MVHQKDLVRADRERWLKQYYFIRAVFSIAWVVAAIAVGASSPVIAGILLVLYPAWDAAANFVDGLRSGGLAQNRTQAFNVVVSLATMVAVLAALQVSMSWVLGGASAPGRSWRDCFKLGRRSGAGKAMARNGRWCSAAASRRWPAASSCFRR